MPAQGSAAIATGSAAATRTANATIAMRTRIRRAAARRPTARGRAGAAAVLARGSRRATTRTSSGGGGGSRGSKFGRPKLEVPESTGKTGLNKGVRVRHPKYGDGIIFQREGD